MHSTVNNIEIDLPSILFKLGCKRAKCTIYCTRCDDTKWFYVRIEMIESGVDQMIIPITFTKIFTCGFWFHGVKIDRNNEWFFTHNESRFKVVIIIAVFTSVADYIRWLAKHTDIFNTEILIKLSYRAFSHTSFVSLVSTNMNHVQIAIDSPIYVFQKKCFHLIIIRWWRWKLLMINCIVIEFAPITVVNEVFHFESESRWILVIMCCTNKIKVIDIYHRQHCDLNRFRIKRLMDFD